MITIKSPAEIEILRANARCVSRILQAVARAAVPGTSTAELDGLAERLIREAGARPAFKGYRGYPASICASINEEVVHGIPDPKRVLKAGDLLSIDIGLVRDGFYADTATTVAVGGADERARRLMAVTCEALRRGVAAARAGRRLSDVSHAIGSYIEGEGFGVARRFVGHGIGRQMHEDPQVPNYGEPGRGPRLRAGMVLAIEPMVMEDRGLEQVLEDDGWTVVTPNGGRAAHFEEMVLITDGEPEILTDGHALRPAVGEEAETAVERQRQRKRNGI